MKWNKDFVASAESLDNGRFGFATGHNDGTIRIWTKDAECIMALKGHTDQVRYFTQLENGWLASGSFDGTVRIWDLDSKTCVQTLKGHKNWITSMTELPNGRLLTGSKDFIARVWDVQSGECLWSRNAKRPVTSVTRLRDNNVAIGDYTGRITIRKADDGTCVKKLEHPLLDHTSNWKVNDMINTAAELVAVYGHGTICCWDTATWNIRFMCKQEDDGFTGAKMLQLGDGSIVSTGIRWERACVEFVQFLNLKTGESRILDEGEENVQFVRALPNGKTILVGRKSSIRLVDTETGNCLATVSGWRDESEFRVNSTAVLSNKLFVTCHDPCTIKVWNLDLLRGEAN